MWEKQLLPPSHAWMACQTNPCKLWKFHNETQIFFCWWEKIITHKRLGHFVFQVKKMQFRLPLSLRPPPCSVLGVTRQTPFAYLAHIYKDLNFVRSGRGGGGTLLRLRLWVCVLPVSCTFRAKNKLSLWSTYLKPVFWWWLSLSWTLFKPTWNQKNGVSLQARQNMKTFSRALIVYY